MNRSSLDDVDEKSRLYADDLSSPEIRLLSAYISLRGRRWRRPALYAVSVIASVILLWLSTQASLRYSRNRSLRLSFDNNVAPSSKQIFDKPRREVADKAVVLASFKNQDAAWAKDVPSSWWVYRYQNDDDRAFRQTPQTGFEVATNEERISSDYSLTVPTRRGNEAMAYLTFIIDNYNALPLVTVFLHGHDRSWHQMAHSVDMLNALNFTAVLDQGYANLNCHDPNHCQEGKVIDLTQGPDDIPFEGFKPIPEFWSLLFGRTGPPSPTRFAARAGAQFAASRDAIRSRPLEFWEALRRPLLRGFWEYRDVLPTVWHQQRKDGSGGRAMGTVFEQTWHVLFMKPPQYCEAITEDHCVNTTFSGAIICDTEEFIPGVTKPDLGAPPPNCAIDKEAMARAAATQRKAVSDDWRPDANDAKDAY